MNEPSVKDPGHPFRRLWTAGGALAAFVLVLATLGCAGPSRSRPNVLWIIWDTARSDHLSLYGHERETTPFLDEWAKGGRVFENCVSTAGYTMPSHAAMFTGLLPSENCANNDHKFLDDSFTTIAELLQGAGYRTYLYSANPNVSAQRNFAQGFADQEHPWIEEFHDRALEIVRGKLPEYDKSSELAERLQAFDQGFTGLTAWNIKAAGELAQEATLSWLERSDSDQPFFALLNYMEAHRPYIPPRKYREMLMSPEEVEASYRVDRTWTTMWEYTFGLVDYTDAEIELTRKTYDATLLELDAMLRELIAALESAGHLDNTVIVLTSDHGEHLGEQHMLDHQYSVYEPVLRVPLIVHFPPRVAPGRDDRPVMNYDVFPTLLELTGVDPPADFRSKAVSLLAPLDDRERLAEEPAFAHLGIRLVSERHPDWDPTPWRRQQRALIDGPNKYLWGSDGRDELFDLESDPLETNDLVADQPDLADRMRVALGAYFAALELCAEIQEQLEQLSPEQRELLRSLGYVE